MWSIIIWHGARLWSKCIKPITTKYHTGNYESKPFIHYMVSFIVVTSSWRTLRTGLVQCLLSKTRSQCFRIRVTSGSVTILSHLVAMSDALELPIRRVSKLGVIACLRCCFLDSLRLLPVLLCHSVAGCSTLSSTIGPELSSRPRTKRQPQQEYEGEHASDYDNPNKPV